MINNEELNSINISNKTNNNEEEIFVNYQLLITFECVRTLSSICSVLGILGNISLICVIVNTSFRHVSYGLLIITIAFFDCIRLLSSIYYYLLFSNIIKINLLRVIIYICLDRYPVFVINWCKVLMSIERILTIRYWEHHTHLDWRSKHKRKQFRRFIYSIIFVLISGLIIEHPNYLLKRYESVNINYNNLMLFIKSNNNYFYGYYQFNENLFIIISYLIFDTTMPIISVLIINLFILREINKLPLSLQVKVKESIGILFFLTILSIAIIPRVFIYYFNYQNYFILNNIYIYILFYICLGFEYINHATTGFACFLSSALLRSELKNMIWTKYIVPNKH